MINTRELIGREKELGWLYSTLDNAASRLPDPTSVLYVQGAPQTGKTELGRNVLRIAAGRGIPAAMIDLGERSMNKYDGDVGKVNLAADLMDQWVHAADAPSGRPVRRNMDCRYPPDSPETAALALNEYSEWLSGSLKKPLVWIPRIGIQ